MPVEHMAAVRIGISGWRYAPWRGVFYPRGLPQKDELPFAAGIFSSIEINGTFYALQRPQSFRNWRDATPEDFVFAVKAPRYVTHILRLRETDAALANFFASGVLELGRKLGPILWQLPPSFRFDAERLETFFARLPSTHGQAAALSRHGGSHAGGETPDAPVRHALEIRHDSFRDPAFIRLLRAHRIGLVVADTVEWPLLMDATADFVYCRLHGSRKLYTSGYGPRALARWADRIRAWTSGREAEGEHAGPPAPSRARDVFVYFDNDAKVRAPFDAQKLIRLLHTHRSRPEPLRARRKPRMSSSA